jgi:Tol biopolymer transport system component
MADDFLLVSHPPGSPLQGIANGATAGVLSADGQTVAFMTDSPDAAPGISGELGQVLLWRLAAGDPTLATHRVGEPAAESIGFAGIASLSADGRWMAYTSSAHDLSLEVVAGSTSEAFLYDAVDSRSVLVSLRSSAIPWSPTTVGGQSLVPSEGRQVISDDGRFASFLSSSRDLAESNQNGRLQVFLYDAALGAAELVSHSTQGRSVPANGWASDAGVSSTGRYVGFASDATDLVPGYLGAARRPRARG